MLIALEQHPNSVTPSECVATLDQKYKNRPVALILGNEIHGVSDEVLAQMDLIMEIPMHGLKESFNVSIATGIALYELTSS